MDTTKKTERDIQKFLQFSAYWIGFGFLAYLCAVAGIFYAWIFIAYLITGFGWFGLRLLKNVKCKGNRTGLSVHFVSASMIILLAATLFTFFSTPTIFSGRDQGSISNAAIILVNTHTLEYSSSVTEIFSEIREIRGAGEAENFPGFYYQKDESIVTHFPIGYIAWTAAFYAIFGLAGFSIANIVTFYLFGSALFLIAKKLFDKNISYIVLFFTILSFPFQWIVKYTLSENLAMAMLWIMVLAILEFIESPTRREFLLISSASLLLMLTRIEGYAIAIMGIVLLLVFSRTRAFILSHKKIVIFSAVISVFLLILNFYVDFYFFKAIAKALTESSSNESISRGIFDSIIRPGVFIGKVYAAFGMAFYLLIGAIGMLYAIRKKYFYILTPLILVLPTFIYLIDSNITADYPWMLRRFVFAIFPIFILYTGYLLWETKKRYSSNKNLSSVHLYIAGALIAFAIFPFLKYLPFSENVSMLEQTETLSNKFSENDLILVDQQASGDQWAMITGPLRTIYGKNAAYIVNPGKIPELGLEKFENVYIITPEDREHIYREALPPNTLTQIDTYTFDTRRLENRNKEMSVRLPSKQREIINGQILKYEPQI